MMLLKLAYTNILKNSSSERVQSKMRSPLRNKIKPRRIRRTLRITLLYQLALTKARNQKRLRPKVDWMIWKILQRKEDRMKTKLQLEKFKSQILRSTRL